MDQLPIFVIATISAILFVGFGYILGNYFPFGGIKQQGAQIEKPITIEEPGESFIDKIWGFFSEGEDDHEREHQEEDQSPSSSIVERSSEIRIPPDDYSHVWYDKKERKIYAKIEGKRIDLDDRITPEQHSLLSFMLLDLQDKVGISASLRSVIEAREGEAFPEKGDDKLVRPSLNPVKSFVNYIQADIPKTDKEASIPSQINEILQDKIKDTPLESQGISIGEWPDRGVVFIVGVDIYSDIHQIPDSKIRLVIREAVKEWESKEGEG